MDGELGRRDGTGAGGDLARDTISWCSNLGNVDYISSPACARSSEPSAPRRAAATAHANPSERVLMSSNWLG